MPERDTPISDSIVNAAMVSGAMWYSTALVVAMLLAATTVKATIDTAPTGTVQCTQSGFSPTFGKAFESGKAIGYEIFIGGVATTTTSSGTPCYFSVASITDATTGVSVDVTDLNSGNEIAYMDGANPACGGTLANSGDGSTIDYKVDVDIVVTETHRSTIQRQLRYPFELKCSVTRDVNENTGTESWTVSTNLVDTAGVSDQATAFTFPIDFNFYTTDARTAVQSSNPFEITQVRENKLLKDLNLNRF